MKKLYGNLSLNVKILGNSILLLIFMIFIAGYSIYSMKSIGSELQSIVDKDIPLTEHLTSITVSQLDQAILIEKILRFGENIFLEESANIAFTKNISEYNKLTSLVNKKIKTAKILSKKMLVSFKNPEEQKEMKYVNQALKTIDEEYNEYVKVAHQIFALYKKGNVKQVHSTLKQFELSEKSFEHELETLLLEIEKSSRTAAAIAAKHEQHAIVMLAIFVFVSIVIALLVSIFTVKYIVSAIKQATILSSGDLTHEIEVTTTDEIGQLLLAINGIRQRLLDMINQISDTTSQLSTSASELSNVSTETTNSVQLQKMETEQVATAMNEMTCSIHDVTSRINKTATTAREASEETINGREVVESAIQQIQNLAKQIEQASETINKLEQDSENISSILDVIKGIAEQTNLLALNAAIEAARAGEQGRGFAVVADEVRTLASRTQQSTEEINQMIEKLQSGSKQAVEVMNSSREQVKSAVEQANFAGASLTTISAAVEQISDMSTEIASAAEEQISVSNEVNENIVRISDMANHTVSATEQISGASHKLTGMATKLQDLMEQFKV